MSFKNEAKRGIYLDNLDITPEFLSSFWSKVKKTNNCWEWTASTAGGGYGHFNYKKKQYTAHRTAYELLVGEIPKGLQIDHLCRNKKCVNPQHLEPVTPSQNICRGDTIPAVHAKKTHCPNGHPYSGDNLYLSGKHQTRRCRICRNKTQIRYKQKLKKVN